MMKLNLLPSISQRSFQVSLCCSRFSQLVHCPCLDCETAFVHLTASSCCRTSATISVLLWVDVSFFHMGRLVPSPKPPLHCCTCPSMSPCLRADFACCMSSVGVHLLPVVNLGATACITASWDSVRVMSSLTLVHLYHKAMKSMWVAT